MKNNDPTQEWLRIAAEARAQQPPEAAAEPAPAWFVEQALTRRRQAQVRAGTTPAPWFAFPGLGRAAIASTVLAAACAVFVLSTGGLDVFTEPVFPDMEEIDLP